jgi:hypothetical protein
MRDISEVFDAIVFAVAIDMIYHMLRPFSMYIQPSQTMCQVILPIDIDLGVSASMR